MHVVAQLRLHVPSEPVLDVRRIPMRDAVHHPRLDAKEHVSAPSAWRSACTKIAVRHADELSSGGGGARLRAEVVGRLPLQVVGLLQRRGVPHMRDGRQALARPPRQGGEVRGTRARHCAHHDMSVCGSPPDGRKSRTSGARAAGAARLHNGDGRGRRHGVSRQFAAKMCRCETPSRRAGSATFEGGSRKASWLGVSLSSPRSPRLGGLSVRISAPKAAGHW